MPRAHSGATSPATASRCAPSASTSREAMWPPLATTPRHFRPFSCALASRAAAASAASSASCGSRCTSSGSESEIVSTTTVLPPAATASQSGVPRPIDERVELLELAVVELGVGAEHDEREALAGARGDRVVAQPGARRGGHDRVAGALERVDGDRGGAQVRLGLAVDDQPGRARARRGPRDPPAARTAAGPSNSASATSISRRAPRWTPPTHTRPASGQAGTAITTASVQLRALEQPGQLVRGRAAQRRVDPLLEARAVHLAQPLGPRRGRRARAGRRVARAHVHDRGARAELARQVLGAPDDDRLQPAGTQTGRRAQRAGEVVRQYPDGAH